MGVVLAIIVLGFLLLPQASLANQASCSFAGATVTVEVTTSTDFAPSVLRTAAGDILVSDGDGSVDCGAATVTNADTIVINKPAALGLDITYISIRTAFVPGLTNEPGGSDEIEFVVNFPAGGNLSIDSRVSTSDTGVPLNVTAGGNEINLNAGEVDGVDADLSVTGASEVTFVPATFDDRVIGSGGTGTPATPFSLPLSICSGLAGGNDIFVGGAADDGICGLGGNDLIEGGGGNDNLRGDLGSATVANDILIGGPGADQLEAQAGDDRIEGGPGNDGAYAGDGNDIVLSGAGRDNMRGDPGDDLIVGDAGRDRLTGGEGNDRLRGKKGRDRLKGEEGDDRHVGGPGADNCLGGPGADTFASCETQSP